MSFGKHPEGILSKKEFLLLLLINSNGDIQDHYASGC